MSCGSTCRRESPSPYTFRIESAMPRAPLVRAVETRRARSPGPTPSMQSAGENPSAPILPRHPAASTARHRRAPLGNGHPLHRYAQIHSRQSLPGPSRGCSAAAALRPEKPNLSVHARFGPVPWAAQTAAGLRKPRARVDPHRRHDPLSPTLLVTTPARPVDCSAAAGWLYSADVGQSAANFGPPSP